MTMVSTGAISIGGNATCGSLNRSVNIELGLSATATSSLNCASFRTLAGVPSGTISLSNFYGKSNSYSVEYLVVAGGGGGGNPFGYYYNAGGGGGAGGYRTGSASLNPGTAYSVTVGAGGSSATKGSSSTFNSLTSAGGGAGQSPCGYGVTCGGSGGGGWASRGSLSSMGSAGNSPAVSPSQGNYGGIPGGYFCPCTWTTAAGGGGGGKGSAAPQVPICYLYGPYITGGAGGSGAAWSNGVTYAGGGGGGAWGCSATAYVGVGGSGGGGNGGYGPVGSTTSAVAGTANKGGGGGGGASIYGYGASGGSGVVIIRYAGSQRGTGGTVTSAGGYTYHTFNSSGTYTA